MKYKVGDTVLIRTDLINGIFYGTHYVNNLIYKNRGKYFKVAKVGSTSYALSDFPDTIGFTEGMVIKVSQGEKI